mgnify:CR=1 FL=1
MDITIFPGKLSGTVRAIPSKSQAHRLLICAAFADAPTTLFCPETNRDIEATMGCLNALGADIVFNHADYRLISTRVLESFADYREVNIFLRGMVPLVGFKSEVVTYERHERLAGESHYPLSKMLALAFDGITSLSNKPIRIITGAGIVVSLIGFIGVIWAIVQAILGSSVAGWASIVCIVCFMGGVQLVCLGVIGEYIGKIYMETKARPRYIISERTWAPYERKYHG